MEEQKKRENAISSSTIAPQYGAMEVPREIVQDVMSPVFIKKPRDNLLDSSRMTLSASSTSTIDSSTMDTDLHMSDVTQKDVDDRDLEENEKEEYEAWRLRELARLARDMAPACGE